MSFGVVSVGAIAADVVLNMPGFNANVDKTLQGVNRIQHGMQGLVGQLGATGRSFTIFAVGAGLAAQRLGKDFVDSASQMEKMELVLTKIIGNKDDANAFLKDLQEFASVIPFQYSEVESAVVKLAAVFDGNMEQVRAWTPVLVEVAAAADLMGVTFEQSSTQFIKLITQGVGATDLFRERAINNMLKVAEMQGKGNQEVAKQVAETVKTSEGLFKELSQDLSLTFSGTVSMIQDQLTFLKRGVLRDSGIFDDMTLAMKYLLSIMREGIPHIVEWVTENKRMVEVIAITAAGVIAFSTTMTILGFVIPPVTNSFGLLNSAVLTLAGSTKLLMTGQFGQLAGYLNLKSIVVGTLIASVAALVYTYRAMSTQTGILSEDNKELLSSIEAIVAFIKGTFNRVVSTMEFSLNNLRLVVTSLAGAFYNLKGGYAAVTGDTEGMKFALDMADSLSEQTDETLARQKELLDFIFSTKVSPDEGGVGKGLLSFFTDLGGIIDSDNLKARLQNLKFVVKNQLNDDADDILSYVDDLMAKLESGLTTDEEAVAHLFKKFSEGFAIDFDALPDNKSGKKTGKSQAQKELERLRNEGERTYRALFPMVDLMMVADESLKGLEAAGHMSAEAMERLQKSLVDTFSELTPDQLNSILDMVPEDNTKLQELIGGLAGIRRELDGIEAAKDAVGRMEELLPFNSVIRDTTSDLQFMQDVLSNVGRTITEDMYGDTAQSVVSQLGADTVEEVNRIIAAFQDAHPAIVPFFEEIRKEIEQRNLQEIDGQVNQILGSVGQLGPKYRQYAAQAEVALRIVRAAQAAASLGLSELIALIIDAAAAFGLFGDEGEKELSDMDKFLEELGELGEEVGQRLTDAIVEFVKTGKAEISDLADFILEEFLRAGISNLIVNPAIDFIGDRLFAKGGAFKDGRIVGEPEFLRTRSGLGLMGEAGPEAILPLKRINGALGVQATPSASAGATVNIYANGVDRESIQVNESEVDGQKLYDIIINTVREGVGNGDLAPELKRALQVY